MTILTNTVAAATVPLSAVAGGKVGVYLASADIVPAWASSMLGPAGALVGTLLAIRWLLARLDKAEAKADKRDAERDTNLALIASMTVQNQQVIEQNSELLQDVKQAIEKCAKMQ
jgi:ABC-type enterochelin transport system ATPase subunit